MLNPEKYGKIIKYNTNKIFSAHSSILAVLCFSEGSCENCPAVLPVGGRIS